MPKYKIGQRVRLLRSSYIGPLAGSVGTVAGDHVFPAVRWDNFHADSIHDDSSVWLVDEDNLELVEDGPTP